MKYLLDYATTDRQRELVEAVIECGSATAAARKIRMDGSSARKVIRNLKARAALSGDAPDHDMKNVVPEPFIVGGVSTLYDDSGNPRMQWVKSKLAPEQYRQIQEEAMHAWASDLPKAVPINQAPGTDSDLLNLYVLTDYHLGMLSWPEETGEAWDIYIAEAMAQQWIERSVLMAPKSGRAVLLLLGDFLHWDGLEAVTPAHRHLLDADVRFQKLVRVAIRAIRLMISRLLEHHDTVTVIIVEGNHDPVSSIWLRESMQAVYSDESRLIVDTSPDPYYAVRHGDVGIYAHHGHIRKQTNIDSVFARKFRSMWGNTKYAYAHMGHLHNEKVRETNLMHITQHRTLAAKDAFASRGGWMSDREASVITYHKNYGRIGQAHLTPDMLGLPESAKLQHRSKS